jgi:hypothetical protein
LFIRSRRLLASFGGDRISVTGFNLRRRKEAKRAAREAVKKAAKNAKGKTEKKGDKK